MAEMWRDALKAFGGVGVAYISIALGAWLLFMIIVPNLIMLDFSLRPLLPLRKIGGPEDVWTLKNYIYLFSNNIHRAVFLKTIWSSIIVTFSALLLCYPLSFYLAKVARGRKLSWLLIALIIPYWINELLRLFAWQLILADSGVFNKILLWSGLIVEPVNFRAGNWAVIVGMAYAYILFMVFPLYNAMESLDHALFMANSAAVNGDAEIAASAIDHISTKKPDFSFIYLGGVDETAHRCGFMSQEYLRSLDNADRAVGAIFDSLRKEQLADHYNILIQSDHGGSATATIEVTWKL